MKPLRPSLRLINFQEKSAQIDLIRVSIREKSYSALLTRQKIEIERKRIVNEQINVLRTLMAESTLEGPSSSNFLNETSYLSLLNTEEKKMVKEKILKLLESF
jgi:hypothetical protein